MSSVLGACLFLIILHLQETSTDSYLKILFFSVFLYCCCCCWDLFLVISKSQNFGNCAAKLTEALPCRDGDQFAHACHQCPAMPIRPGTLAQQKLSQTYQKSSNSAKDLAQDKQQANTDVENNSSRCLWGLLEAYSVQ